MIKTGNNTPETNGQSINIGSRPSISELNESGTRITTTSSLPVPPPQPK